MKRKLTTLEKEILKEQGYEPPEKVEEEEEALCLNALADCLNCKEC